MVQKNVIEDMSNNITSYDWVDKCLRFQSANHSEQTKLNNLKLSIKRLTTDCELLNEG